MQKPIKVLEQDFIHDYFNKVLHNIEYLIYHDVKNIEESKDEVILLMEEIYDIMGQREVHELFNTCDRDWAERASMATRVKFKQITQIHSTMLKLSSDLRVDLRGKAHTNDPIWGVTSIDSRVLTLEETVTPIVDYLSELKSNPLNTLGRLVSDSKYVKNLQDRVSRLEVFTSF